MGLTLKTLKNEISIDSQLATQNNEHEVRAKFKDSEFTGASALDFTVLSGSGTFSTYLGSYILYGTSASYGSVVYVDFETIPGQYYTFHYDYISRTGSSSIDAGLTSAEPTSRDQWNNFAWVAAFSPIADRAVIFQAQSEQTYFVMGHFGGSASDNIRFDNLRVFPHNIPKNLKITQFNIRTPSVGAHLYNANADAGYVKHTYGEKAYFTIPSTKYFTMTSQDEITVRGVLEND